MVVKPTRSSLLDALLHSDEPSISTRFGSISQVDWGGAGIARINEWVTADALYVLRVAGRI
ncbi:MAG: hypothetical protein ACREQH_03215 [Candidatus Binatus sp.]